MMNYETFKKEVQREFVNYIPENLNIENVRWSTMPKVNEVVDAITLISKNSALQPVIFVNDMYRCYQEAGNFEKAMRMSIAHLSDAQARQMILQDGNLKFNPIKMTEDVNAKDSIVFQLINTKQNEELLKGLPNRSFCDLSIIYRLVRDCDSAYSCSAIIDNQLLLKLGLTEQQLFEVAWNNSKRLRPITVKSMSQTLRELCTNENVPEILMLDDLMLDDQNTLWVFSNDAGIHGAVAMLYEEKFHALAEKLGSNLYILPSSIHEILALSEKSDRDSDELTEMVVQTNSSEVDISDKLSDQLYYYDRVLRRIDLAANLGK